MKTRFKVAGVVIGSAALLMTGIGIANASNSNGSPRVAPGPGVTFRPATAPAADTSADESVLTPMTPCRIVDTRLAGGPVLSTRSFYVGGTTEFVTQGGNVGGCGIPVGTTAIAANIVATGETGSGYMKAWPAGATAPTASIINFSRGVTIANELTLAINPTAALALNVLASAHTQVVIDVTGYYRPQISADITSSGAFFNNTARVLSVTHPGTGSYVVTVDRPSEVCSAQVTSVDAGHWADAITEANGTVDVHTQALVGGVATPVDDEFNFTLVC